MSAPTTAPAPASRAPKPDNVTAASTSTDASASEGPLAGAVYDHQHDHEHDRRVHPRSNGASTDANADGDGDAAAADADAAAHSPSPAASLHRHALESVFAFLSLRDLAAALCVARSWLGAVGTMRRLEVAMEEWVELDVTVVSQSLLGRHMSALGDWRVPVWLSASSLAPLAERMPHLRALTCRLDPPQCRPDPDAHCQPDTDGRPTLFGFPAAMRSLDIDFEYDPAQADVRALIAAVAQLPLLEELRIRLPIADPQFSFAPLAALPLLRSLDLSAAFEMDELTDAQVDQLRALPHLQKFMLQMEIDLLRRLLRQPHDLQWQEISVPSPLDDETAALLPLLPSLTRLNDGAISCRRFEWLRGLPNLTDLGLSFFGNDTAGRADSLLAALRHCTNIEILSLSYCSDLTAAHLADLLPRLPRLRQLTLSALSIDSLAFLAQAPMTTQLSSLHLDGCRKLPLSDLVHVHSLRGLTQLKLTCSFTRSLDEHERSLLTPPSSLLPRLADFAFGYYSTPTDSDYDIMDPTGQNDHEDYDGQGEFDGADSVDGHSDDDDGGHADADADCAVGADPEEDAGRDADADA